MSELSSRYPYYLANTAVFANEDLKVRDKFTGEVVCHVALADDGVIDQAIAAAVSATKPMRKMKAYERRDVLMSCVAAFERRSDHLAYALCVEAGKPIKDARGEVTRLIDTFRIAAEESTRIYGEVVPLDVSPRARDYQGMWKRVPIGPCSFIAPFNFPLNLAAHKIAPALAVGCPFVLKPASATPIGALLIAEALAETDLPRGAFSILPCKRDGADRLTEDERIKLLSFTGSDAVGWALKAKAGKKKVVLELGGNAACIVDETADLDDAVERIVVGAFYQSGQSCISVQRILVHAQIYEAFKARLVEATRALRAGDPKDEANFLGPLIAEDEAERLEHWVASARDQGATVLCGGTRRGALFDATLLEGVGPRDPLRADEAFGPIAVLSKFERFEDALAEANDSRFGLQVGVFTRDLYRAHQAWDDVEAGGVIVGDVPSWRVDHMPYGGVKDSGLGREGLRFSMEEMTEIRLMVLRTPPPRS